MPTKRPTKRRHSLATFFAGIRRHQASPAELASAGFSQAELTRAVKAGRLRQGVTGYWLPAAPDPGAVRVFYWSLRQGDEIL